MLKVCYAQFSNFLSFKENIQLTNLEPITVLVGPNNAGKSNIIRTFKFYQELLILEKNQKIMGDILEFINKENLGIEGSITDLTVSYDFEDSTLPFDKLKIIHTIRFDFRGQFESERLIFEKEVEMTRKDITIYRKENQEGQFVYLQQNTDLISEFLTGHNPSNFKTTNPEGHFTKLDWTRYQPFHINESLNPNALKVFNQIKEFISKWIFIPANRFTEVIGDEMAEIDSNGRNVENILSRWLSSKRKPTNNFLETVNETFRTKDINFSEDGKRAIIGENELIKVPLDHYGSGFEQFLIIFQRFFVEFVKDAVIFIEEPEVHLHPFLQRKLLKIIFDSSKYNQFFITTHSTIFCRYQLGLIKPFLIRKHEYQTQAKEITEELMDEIKSALGYVNSDLFGYNAVLIVEGHSEEETIPLLAKNLNIDIVNDGIRILNSKGYGNLRQIKNIIDLLHDTGTSVYAIYDNHKKDQGKLDGLKRALSTTHNIELIKDFEYSFGDDVLTKTMVNILLDKNISFNENEKDDLKIKLGNKETNTFDTLYNLYAQKTKELLTKVHFGIHLAKFLEINPQWKGKSPFELLLKEIHEKIEDQLNDIGKTV